MTRRHALVVPVAEAARLTADDAAAIKRTLESRLPNHRVIIVATSAVAMLELRDVDPLDVTP